MKEIRYLLTAWGNWAGTRVGTEYPMSSWPVPMASSDIRPMLCDDKAQKIDRAVARLKQVDSLGYDIIVAYYRGKASCRAIGRALKKDHKSISGYLIRSEAYIAGQVDALLEG
ncbi:hypothetical protein BJP41_06335 [Candidatus Williamhamiltonella defendens]|uniref:Antitermination protein Q n=1 Tax=Candidatus Williamhamiltonella defendens TaxID=138072 RepID=A0A2D3T2G2_9ENTR|nr:antiterminator Q family protein [Candidatus Hamiltonella defensa]ASV34061.1 hypothetical protein CJJ18_08840 [Candidatus Hamiltonella defensa]ATW30009.1 hypothetical protein BJP41_06335 [Candidatus Hamiltonella defensa]ATW31983.1 hypothetical protein BJP42_06430 [Candidatus Hamiltonella defensa]AWK17016.1 hypothetical protein CCS40_08655 [Candidatus Hamiltonella defensa]AYB48685.1 hypothetical protein CJJ19_03490 [Candidatus Hamiltonella defensa]